MLRKFIAVIAGVLLHYVLIIAGSRLAWLLIVGNLDRTKIEYKDGVIRWMLWRTFAIDPAVAVVVGALLGRLSCTLRSRLLVHLSFRVSNARWLRDGMPNKSLDASGGGVFLN